MNGKLFLGDAQHPFLFPQRKFEKALEGHGNQL
jgi:hypothetical protein